MSSSAGAAGEVPTCSPGKSMYKCSTLGRKMSTNATMPHFHNHLLHHQTTSGGGGGAGAVGGSDFISVASGGGGGSVLGISMGTMRSGQHQQQFSNELPLIIPMPLQMDQKQQPNNNVPILNSILTSSSASGHNNNNSNYPGNGPSGSAPGSTSTLKKRVQIQEVTV